MNDSGKCVDKKPARNYRRTSCLSQQYESVPKCIPKCAPKTCLTQQYECVPECVPKCISKCVPKTCLTQQYECVPKKAECEILTCPKKELTFSQYADVTARLYPKPSQPPSDSIPRKIWRNISRSLNKLVSSSSRSDPFFCDTCNSISCVCRVSDEEDLDSEDNVVSDCECNSKKSECDERCDNLPVAESAHSNDSCFFDANKRNPPSESDVSKCPFSGYYNEPCPFRKECVSKCKAQCAPRTCEGYEEEPDEKCPGGYRSQFATNYYESLCAAIKNAGCLDECKSQCAFKTSLKPFEENPELRISKVKLSCRKPKKISTKTKFVCKTRLNGRCVVKVCRSTCTTQPVCYFVKDKKCVDKCSSPCAPKLEPLAKGTSKTGLDSGLKRPIEKCVKECVSRCAVTSNQFVCKNVSPCPPKIEPLAKGTSKTCLDSGLKRPIEKCVKECTSRCAVTSDKPVCAYVKEGKCLDNCNSPCASKLPTDLEKCKKNISNSLSNEPIQTCFKDCRNPCSAAMPAIICSYMKNDSRFGKCYGPCASSKRYCSKPFAEYVAKLVCQPTCKTSSNDAQKCKCKTASTIVCTDDLKPVCKSKGTEKCLDVCTKPCSTTPVKVCSIKCNTTKCLDVRTKECNTKCVEVCSIQSNTKCVDVCTKECNTSSSKKFDLCKSTLKHAIKEYLSECDILDEAINGYMQRSMNSKSTEILVDCGTCRRQIDECHCDNKPSYSNVNEKTSNSLDEVQQMYVPAQETPRKHLSNSSAYSSPIENKINSPNTSVGKTIVPVQESARKTHGSSATSLKSRNVSFDKTKNLNNQLSFLNEQALFGKQSEGSGFDIVQPEDVRRTLEDLHETKNEDVKTGTTKVLPKVAKKKPLPRKPEVHQPLHADSAIPLYSYKARGGSRNSRITFIPFKIYKLGERNSGTRARGPEQDFYSIRDYHLSNGTLFEDSNFPADNSSLFYSKNPDRYYEWKRPHEIVDNPKLFVEGYSRFDVQQGELGDCWLLAAVANLTLYRRLFFQIVPDDQDFDEKYAGIFHFRFWQYGRWIDVVIDDRLPTYRGQLVFLRSPEENEFWSALLEKAYAKLHGSYEALKGGSTCEAMEDFTGGVTEMYEMNSSPPDLFKIILKAYERSSLMGCSIEPDPNVLEAETPEGLIRGHAYSITRVKYVDIQTPNTMGKIPLLRLRNPWGNETEWNGPWSDKSPEWRFIPDHEKEELGLTFDDDGEFWMSFKDFQNRFNRLEICNLNPDSLTEEEMREGNKKQWEMSVFEGEWVRGVTAGGCRNFLETFWHNPQYRITLTEVDDGDDEGKCTVIVALMQKNRRSQRNMGIDVLTIGFAIYHLPYPDRVPKPLDLKFFKYNASVARSPSFINLREVSCRFKLPPGTYCIVPSTFDPNEEGEFLLRVFSEHKNNMEENDEKVGYGDVDPKVETETPTPEFEEQTDKAYGLFLKIAGEDLEVDWKELKEILDYSMRSELSVDKKRVDGLDAAPGTESQGAGDGLLMTILGLICGALCKDTPLADIIPAPTEAPVTMSAYHELDNESFSKDICRSMVAMLDADKSGKLGYEEFKKLWLDLRNWKEVFHLYDKDNSKTLSGYELRQALNSAGYHINNHILNILIHRYGTQDGHLSFDDFIMCAVKLKCMIDKFKDKDLDNTESATFTLEEWLESTLYS